MIGKDKLKIHLSCLSDLNRIGYDIHTLGNGIYASGYHSEWAKLRSAHLGNLYKTETASTDLVDVLQIAKGGNINMGNASSLQNGRTGRNLIICAIDLNV